jgi:sucrose-6-phosphate hydrolase SacC (GH32 family)
VWECPLLIELPLEGGGSRWLFKVDALHDAPGSGALYQVGQFDGTRFTPEGEWQVADWGADFYAAIAWHEPRDEFGRPLWIGWMGNHAYQGKLPLQGWRGAMSLPRRIWLRRVNDTIRLCQMIEPAAAMAIAAVKLSGPALCSSGRVSLGSEPIALRLSDKAGRFMEIDYANSDLRVTRHDPISPFLNRVQHAELSKGVGVELWLDHGSMELLSSDGALSLTLQHRMTGDELMCERGLKI